MEVVNYYKDTVRMLWRSLKYGEDGEADTADIRRWILLSSEAIKKIQELIISSTLDFNKRRSLQTQCGLLFTIRERLKALIKRPHKDDDDVLEVKRQKLDDTQPTAIEEPTEVSPPVVSEQPRESNIRGGSIQVDDELVCWNDVESAFQNNIRCGVINNIKHLDLAPFLTSAQDLFKLKIREVLKKLNSVKVNVTLAAEFSIVKEDEEIVEMKFFNTKSAAIFLTSDLDAWFQKHVRDPVMTDIEEFQERESGWTLRSILNLTVNIMKYNPLRAGNQKEKHIELPPPLRNTGSCINVRNDDDQCFKWAVYSAIYPCENGHRCEVQTYKKYDTIEYQKDGIYTKLQFGGIEFPTRPSQIPKFERMNRNREISINLYMMKKNSEKYTVVPCCLTSEKMKNHINLLIIQDKYIDENDDNPELGEPPRLHYVWIKDMSALLRKQLTKHHSKIYVCDRCLHYFTIEENLIAHEEDCVQLNKCKVQMPKQGEKIEFKNFANREQVPIVVYADFECMLKPVEEERAYQEHEPISIGFYIQYSHDSTKSKFHSYRKQRVSDENPAEWFVSQLRDLAYQLEDLHCDPVPMRDVDEEKFRQAITCHICGKPFKADDKKVRDHCHITGR